MHTVHLLSLQLIVTLCMKGNKCDNDKRVEMSKRGIRERRRGRAGKEEEAKENAEGGRANV